MVADPRRRNMRAIAFPAVFVLSAALAAAQTAADRAPGPGDPAPPLSVEQVLTEGADLPLAGAFDWKHFAGRWVVVEFATSWCTGCRLAAPHVNELARSLKGRPVAFVTISNESEETVRKMVSDLALETWVSRDPDGSTFEAFWVGGIPDAVLVDPQGKIAALLHPTELTRALLDDALAGRKLTLPDRMRPPRARRCWDQRAPAGETPLEPGTFVFQPIDKPSGMGRQNPKTGEISLGGVSPVALLSTAWDVPARDVEVVAPLSGDLRFQVRARGREGTLASTRALLRERLPAELGIAVVEEKRRMPAMLLKRVPGHDGPPAATAEKGGRMAVGAVDLQRARIASLVSLLNGLSKTPVLDQTGLDGEYRLKLDWNPTGGAEALRKALGGIGLALEAGEGDVRKVVVKPG
jgi:uncharacterized protein (TIGR03435 family)